MSDDSRGDYPDPTTSKAEVLIVSGDAARREVATGAALIAGLAIVPGPASTRLHDDALDIVLADIRGCDDEAAEALLREIEGAMRGRPLRVVVALHDAQIDLAAACLFGSHVELLCEPTLIDFATALAAARVDPARRAREGEGEAERLRRRNEEIARMAETLARLARGEGERDDPADGHVRDVARAYGAPPAAYLSAAPAGAVPATQAIAPKTVRAAIRARRMRAQFFASDLFADPAWDMLLDLFAASLEGVRVSVSSLCIAAAVPGTTALRWIASMVDAGLFTRTADPSDGRRAYIALSADANAGMAGYFAAIRSAGLTSA